MGNANAVSRPSFLGSAMNRRGKEIIRRRRVEEGNHLAQDV